MFEVLMTRQALAMESLMTKQPTSNPQLMDEARKDLSSALEKALQASRQVATDDG